MLWKGLHKNSATWLFCPSNDLKIKRKTVIFVPESQNSCKKLFNFVKICRISCCFCETSSNDLGSKLKFPTFHCLSTKNDIFKKRWEKIIKLFSFFVQRRNRTYKLHSNSWNSAQTYVFFRFSPSEHPLDQRFHFSVF